MLNSAGSTTLLKFLPPVISVVALEWGLIGDMGKMLNFIKTIFYSTPVHRTD